ncbi:MAG: hypothetical protein BWY85_00117 [Firmicutes bacterium ADurb.Bin506]|nr:MAG: hypothetical protein BWY85_00117 [Firmicutes bacterium ADurb.Bin506]
MGMSKEYFEAFIAYCSEHRPPGWALDVCRSSGTFTWFNFTKRNVYASPDWSEDGMVPADISTDDEEGCARHPNNPCEFALPMLVSARARAEVYMQRLRPYLDAMPDVHPAPLRVRFAGVDYVKAHYHEKWFKLTAEGWCRQIPESLNMALEQLSAAAEAEVAAAK